MIAQFHDIHDVCRELADEAPHIYRKIVRMRVHRQCQQSSEEDAFSWQIGLWVTAIVKDESSSWLIEFGEPSGIDDHTLADDSEKLAGSRRAAEWAQMVYQTAKENGLTVRNGKWE